MHRHDGRILAQLAHAGSQTPLSDVEPIAPSAVANHMTGRDVAEASGDEVAATVAAFGAAAARAAEAGFDGVHIHGANGYLISDGDADFLSLSRPLLREPDLVRKLEAGRTGLVDCTSCNICAMHMEIDPLRCWRKPRRRLFEHAARRFSGRLNPKRLDTG